SEPALSDHRRPACSETSAARRLQGATLLLLLQPAPLRKRLVPLLVAVLPRTLLGQVTCRPKLPLTCAVLLRTVLELSATRPLFPLTPTVFPMIVDPTPAAMPLAVLKLESLPVSRLRAPTLIPSPFSARTQSLTRACWFTPIPTLLLPITCRRSTVI